MDRPPNFSIIIPNFNGSPYLKLCLPSLLASISKTRNTKYEIILIDNGSTDDSIDVFSHLLPPTTSLTTKIILHPKNTGVSPAFAQGVERSSFPWTVILNNDITFTPNWFSLISQAISKNKDPKVVTFFGTILNHDGSKIESQGLEFSYRGKCLNTNNGKPYSSEVPSIQSFPTLIWGAPAACVVYHRDTILKIGNFDPDFFAYEEDVDLALRLSCLGYKTLYVPPAISYHLGGATSSKMGNFRHRMDTKNWFFIIIKNYSLREIGANFFPIIGERLRNLSYLVKNTPFQLLLQSILATYYEVVKQIPSMIRKRKAIKKLIKSAT